MPTEDLTAAPVPLHIGGRDLLLTRINDNDISALNTWIRGRFIEMARKSLEGETDPKLRDETISIAMREAAKLTWMSGTGAEMIATPEGLARIIYEATRTHNPETSFEWLRQQLFEPDSVRLSKDALHDIRPKAKVKKGPTVKGRRSQKK